MSELPVSLLLVDEDSRLAPLIRDEAAARGFRMTCTSSLVEAVAAAQSETFDAALVHLDSGPDPKFDALRQLKQISPDTEIIIVSATTSLASAIKSYELAAFAFVQTPVASAQLFTTIDRALERRRITLHNRRLLWELQTINEIAEGISRSLELDDVLNGALQRVVRAFDGVAGAIRLRDESTGLYEVRAYVGTPGAQLSWGTDGMPPRPSERVIGARTPIVIEDLASEVPPESVASLAVRSVMSVPMLAGDELVGTMTVGTAAPYRFHYADERLLAIIAAQILAAVQNARLHDSVRRGKREWERTFDAIAEPIAVFDSKGRILRGNRALATVLGRSVTALRHATCGEVGFCGSNCPDCAVGRALASGTADSAEITLPSGQIFSVTTFPVGGADDASVVQVAKDVTEQIQSARQLQQVGDELAMTNAQLVATVDQLKSTQAQLLQAEKLSAIGQLVAGVAHELNNPLTSVIGYAQLLEEELRSSEEGVEQRAAGDVADDLQRIAEESERAARIVRNLLAFARRQTAARVPQDVTELGSRVLSLRTYDLRLNDVELVTQFEPDLPEVVIDGGQLQQALLNLILNAEQAMRNRPVRRLTVGAHYDPPAAAVALFVDDTGHGIDQANRSRIFDPFFTTREVGEGTGLGLSICYGIIRDHGGEIDVESRVDVGTRFTLRLPARIESHGIQQEVLIAHMDQGERDFLSAALGAWGYRVVALGRLEDALSRYRRGGLHAVLLDRSLLAANVAAWTAARAEAPTAVPTILLAPAGSDETIERFGREHGSAVLAPPYQLHALRSAVRAIGKEKEYV